MNYLYIISQIFALGAFIISLISFHRKKKENIMRTALIANFLDMIHYIFLGAYNGFLTKVLAFVRNSFIIYKDKRKIKSNIYLVVFIILYLITSIITYKNLYSILPSIAAIIYLIAIWNGNESTIKKAGCGCYFLWLTYNIFVFSVIGIISNIVAIISTFIAVLNAKN